MTISTHFRPTSTIGLSAAANGPTPLGHHGQHRSFIARQASVDVSAGENGCCLVKALISNLLTFATRSRRKGADLGGGGGGKDAQQRPGPGNNGNGVCPVPETVTAASTAACTSDGGTKKTGVVSFSQADSAKSARKAVQSVDTCVADSFDEQMIDKICTLPRNLDRNEWLAAHVLALFEHVNGISCTLSQICTPVTCSTMSFPGNQKAPWLDDRGKRHNYPAMRYIDSVMSQCEAARTNQTIFPTKYGVPFSTDFEQHCARMVRLLWHCLGHMYIKHWEHLGALNLRSQFGLVMAHMARLAKQYSLLQEKELSLLLNTLQLARPSTIQQQQQQQSRPLKRVLDETTGSGGTTTTTTSNNSVAANPSTVQGQIQQQQRKKEAAAAQSGKDHQQQQQAMAMKSGSWGGHSAAAAAVMAVQTGGAGMLPTATNCVCAQTC